MDVGLIEAWIRWTTGDLRHDHLLFGMSIRWWGRTAQIANFLAAVLLAWDVAASRTMNAFAKWLEASRLWFTSSDEDRSQPQEPFGAELGYLSLWCIGCALAFAALYPFMRWFDMDPERRGWILWLDTTFLRRLLLLPVWLSFMALGLWITHAFVLPAITWVSQVPRFPSRLRLPALCLLVCGLHFGLLAI